MGCNCTKGIEAYIVKRPGQPDRRVTSKDTATTLVRGVAGAQVQPVGGAK